MGLFKKKTKGLFKYHGLVNFWGKVLTQEDRDTVLANYGKGGMGIDPKDLIIGNVVSSWGPNHKISRVTFLNDIIGYLIKPEFIEIGNKIITEAEKHITRNINVLDVHFYYQTKIKFYYRNRDTGDNLNKAISACKEQISISEAAKKEFEKDKYLDFIPNHGGYEQLSIILEKQKSYKEAILLCEQALKQGWTNDWEHRINRLTKKLEKLN